MLSGDDPMGEYCAHLDVVDVGVCPTCLQTKLTHVWRGEPEETTMASDPREPHPSFDASDKKRTSKKKKKSVTIIADESLSKTGLPLVDRIAKETALRVIKEVADDGISVESECNNQVWGVEVKPVESHWLSIRPKSWVKGLAGSNKVFPSKTTSESQSSPSRLQKKEQRKFGALRPLQVEGFVIPVAEAVVTSSEGVIEGMPDEILKPEDMNQRLRTSYNTVLSWLRDLPSPQAHLLPQLDEEGVLEDEVVVGSAAALSQRNDDEEDLTLVGGHLHEIAEEQEINSSEEASITNHLNQVSSFGKFLIRAAQRQPRAGLSRVALATSGKS